MLSVIEITSRPPMVSPLMADWKDQKQENGMVSKGSKRTEAHWLMSTILAFAASILCFKSENRLKPCTPAALQEHFPLPGHTPSLSFIPQHLISMKSETCYPFGGSNRPIDLRIPLKAPSTLAHTSPVHLLVCEDLSWSPRDHFSMPRGWHRAGTQEADKLNYTI